MLKLYVKKINTLLYVSVMQQHIVCLCICCIPCTEVGRQTVFLHCGRANMSVHIAAQDVQLSFCFGPVLVLSLTGLV